MFKKLWVNALRALSREGRGCGAFGFAPDASLAFGAGAACLRRDSAYNALGALCQVSGRAEWLAGAGGFWWCNGWLCRVSPDIKVEVGLSDIGEEILFKMIVANIDLVDLVHYIEERI